MTLKQSEIIYCIVHALRFFAGYKQLFSIKNGKNKKESDRPSRYQLK